MNEVAFYAPLKSPHHPNPSGDRQIARLLFTALTEANFKPLLVSEFRSLEKTGSQALQLRYIRIGRYLAKRLIRRWQKAHFKPRFWLTYHLYYKAPDLIGPFVCAELNIPYIVAEASWSPKRSDGQWAEFNQMVKLALKQADLILNLNPVDYPALIEFYSTTQGKRSIIRQLPLFVNCIPRHAPSLETVASEFNIDPSRPWLITIAMMRPGDKLNSYKILAEALKYTSKSFHLLVVGTGKCEHEVRKLFAADKRVRFAGEVQNQSLIDMLQHFDINIWPAVNEAMGLNFLEAQSQGVTVVAGDERGVHSVVSHNYSGMLAPAKDPKALADLLDHFLSDPQRLSTFKANAKQYVSENHSLQITAKRLSDFIREIETVNR